VRPQRTIGARCYLQEVDDAELEAFAREHISYELWMLVQTAVYLRNTPIDASQVEINAHLESFALHARVLGDFLANKKGGNGDVLACMYAETWPGELVLEGLSTTISKQVAHLTSSRMGKQPIAFWDVTGRILKSFRSFLRALSRTRRQWFDWYEVTEMPESLSGE
jgi:hypothetical protein